MKHTLTSKRAPIQEIRELMAMPFFRVDFKLRMDQDEVSDAIEKFQRNKPGITDYKKFLKYEEKNKSQAAEDLFSDYKMNDDYHLLSEEFRKRTRFLLQLPDDEMTFENVKIVFDAYLACVKFLIANITNENVNVFVEIDRILAITPAILIKDRLLEKEKAQILNEFEEYIRKIEQIRFDLNPNQLSDLLLAITHIVYCYKVYCYEFKIGIRYDVITYLYNIPQWMGTMYRDIDPEVKINFSLLCLHLSFDIFKWKKRLETELGISYNTFNYFRFILNDTLQLLKRENKSFYIPVFEWFINRLDNDITQHLVPTFRLSYNHLHDIEKVKIVSCCERFLNYRFPITIESVISYLRQFDSLEDAQSVIKILNAIDFLDFWQLSERLEDALKQMKKKNGDLAICPLGPVSGSTSLMQYYIAHSNFNGVTFFNSVKDAISESDKRSCICFIDDCAISGVQSNDIFQTLMGNILPEDKEMIVLSSKERKELSKRKLGIALSIISDTAILSFKQTLDTLDLKDAIVTFGSVTQENEKAFSPASRVYWRDSNERNRMKKVFQILGIKILETKAQEKGWSKEIQRMHSLGYGDFQRLLIFPYSVPKSTVSALWASRNDSSFKWFPLFPLAIQDDSYSPYQ